MQGALTVSGHKVLRVLQAGELYERVALAISILCDMVSTAGAEQQCTTFSFLQSFYSKPSNPFNSAMIHTVILLMVTLCIMSRISFG